MELSALGRERRRFPRLLLDLPLEYRVVNAQYAHGGLVVNASEVGLLIQSIKNIPIGTRMKIAVLFPKGFELTCFEVLGEIIWKDPHWEADWEGFQYGLRFIQLLEEDRRKLRQVLTGRMLMKETAPFA
jgi:hypothetical protein